MTLPLGIWDQTFSDREDPAGHGSSVQHRDQHLSVWDREVQELEGLVLFVEHQVTLDPWDLDERDTRVAGPHRDDVEFQDVLEFGHEAIQTLKIPGAQQHTWDFIFLMSHVSSLKAQ